MYLIYTEFEEVYKAEEITEDDINASLEGVILIMRINDMHYHSTEGWLEITSWVNSPNTNFIK